MSLPDETRNERREDDLSQLWSEAQAQARRFWAYLRSRPSECWAFFAAGLVIGLLIG